MTTWKNKLIGYSISEIKPGMRVRVSKFSEKVGWSIELNNELYSQIYTVRDMNGSLPNYITLTHNETTWEVSPRFLKAHFIEVTV